MGSGVCCPDLSSVFGTHVIGTELTPTSCPPSLPHPKITKCNFKERDSLVTTQFMDLVTASLLASSRWPVVETHSRLPRAGLASHLL